MSHELNDQERERRESLAQLRELGIDPYPAAKYDVNITAAEIKKQFDDNEAGLQDICIAGRLMSRRIMGKASFGEIMDHTGRVQVYFNRDEICPDEDKTMYNVVFKKLLDIGDFIGIKGFAFRTQVGEISIQVKEFTVLSKSLRLVTASVNDSGMQKSGGQPGHPASVLAVTDRSVAMTLRSISAVSGLGSSSRSAAL